MPLQKDEDYGTNTDGSKNQDYCVYCYKDGAFAQDCTMQEMIDFCTPHMVGHGPYKTEAEARQGMAQFFPTLKRWKDA